MKIAYIILAHKYPQQLARLVHSLNDDETSFWIHVDRKTDLVTSQSIVSHLKNNSNVHFVKRQNVYWGGFSQVSATINSLKEALNHHEKFDYIKLISGQDYPLTSQKKIKDFLKQNHNKSFIEYFSLPHENWELGGEKGGGINRIKYYYLHLRSRQLCLPIKRKFPKGFKPFAGSAYWFLSREHAEYIVEVTQNNQSFNNFFKLAANPDEIFFQTILLNAPLKRDIVNNDLTYTEWGCNSPNPEILGKKHWEKLMGSQCLFARKFDITKDSEILDLLDRNILG